MPKILPPPVPVWTLLLFLAFSGDAQVRITEFMASNTSSIADEDGAFSDWIEIQNTTATNVNLLNWALTDSAGNASKWLFPATNLAPGNFLLVFASGKDRHVAGLFLTRTPTENFQAPGWWPGKATWRHFRRCPSTPSSAD